MNGYFAFALSEQTLGILHLFSISRSNHLYIGELTS